VGRAKGTFDLIDAAREALSQGMDVSFDLVGDELTPGEYQQVRDYIANPALNGCVRLHAAAYGSEKIRFFCKAHVFVYPSYHEGMPIAVIEAMACGLPIVATRVGGLPDLVMHGANGLLVDPARPDQLVSALRKLSNNNHCLHSMHEKSYQFAFERYDIEQHVAQLMNVYKEALSGR
jgi:glycosyltransferase involved in cell wall biosynthesis